MPGIRSCATPTACFAFLIPQLRLHISQTLYLYHRLNSPVLLDQVSRNSRNQNFLTGLYTRTMPKLTDAKSGSQKRLVGEDVAEVRGPDCGHVAGKVVDLRGALRQTPDLSNEALR